VWVQLGDNWRILNRRALLTFHQACEARTISGAPRALNLSQPSVYSATAMLEGFWIRGEFRRSRELADCPKFAFMQCWLGSL